MAGTLHTGLGDGSALPSSTGLRALASWLIPVVDPSSSEWHGGWLSTHLWYIRAYLWILLLAPVLARLARRLRLALPIFAAGVVSLERLARHDVSVAGSGTSHIVIGDAFTYGAFVVLGMAYRRRQWDPDRRLLGVGAITAGAGSVVYALTAGLPTGGVNDSYPAVALTGLAWLLAAGAAERPLRRLAQAPPVHRATLALNRRAVTVYLWHPAALVVAYIVVDRWESHTGPVAAFAVLTVTVAVTALAVAAVGWVEDLAGRVPGGSVRRPVHLAAVVTPAASAVAVAILLVALPVSVDSAAHASGSIRAKRVALPPPSYRAALNDAAFSPRAAASETGRLRLPGGELPAAQLHHALGRWMARQDGFDSVAVAVTVAGRIWAGDAHRAGVAPATRALTTVDDNNVALGTWPLCPCSTDGRGEKRYTAIGQYSGHGGLYHFPGKMTLALHVEPPVEGAEGLAALLAEELLPVMHVRNP